MQDVKQYLDVIHLIVDLSLIYILLIKKTSYHIHVHNEINADAVNVEKADIHTSAEIKDKNSDN